MSAELSEFSQSTLFDHTQDHPGQYAKNIITVAEGLLAHLCQGKSIDAPLIRGMMCDAFGGADADGKWLWKDAYEAQEIAGVLFMRRYGQAMRVFVESCKQRFFGHLLTSMKCPTLIRAIEDDLAHDRAPVIQIVSTSEALLQRKLDEIPSEEWSDLNIDVTPREYVMEYLMNSFPTQLYELYQEDNGDTSSRPAFDHEGKPVPNMEAIERRDALVKRLASLPAIPSGLDQIIQHFGHDQVAEVTGRSIRLVMDDGKLCV